ncbi:MAG: DNA-binding transcriptional regulator [Holophagaceae bacterium]
MPNLRHIALLVPVSREYGRGISQGVASYALERGDWVIFPQRSDFKELPAWLTRTRIDGIIGFIDSPELGQQLMALGVPIVDVQGKGNCPTAPVYDTDPVQVARFAGDFFIHAGFTQFGFCGYPGVFFSDRRSEAYCDYLQSRGQGVHVYAPASSAMGVQDNLYREWGALEYENQLTGWLTRVPKPIAILACNDIRGQQLIHACRDLGISMPSDVAVIGVDNDEIICRQCRPTLSSIAPDTERIGRLAAETLTRMMDGETVEPILANQPPTRIVERQSTDITMTQDPIVLAASRFIRNRVCDDISVDQVCELVDCSRSTLDGLFKKHLGRPVAQEMRRVRLNRATRLLLDSPLTVEDVARECGFRSATYFCRFFKRETGTTPVLYRNSKSRR